MSLLPTCTADGKVSFSSNIGRSYTLDMLIPLVHKHMCKVYKWNEMSTLNPGTFGYDNMAYSLHVLHEEYEDNMTDDEMAHWVHEGWKLNYTYWRDYKPFERKQDEKTPTYKAPFSPLGDDRRNLCAITDYKDLSQEEKEKDLVIVAAVKSWINTSNEKNKE